jgi:hypothetical protein
VARKVKRDMRYLEASIIDAYSGHGEPSSALRSVFEDTFGCGMESLAEGKPDIAAVFTKTDEVLVTKIREKMDDNGSKGVPLFSYTLEEEAHTRGRPIIAVSPHCFIRTVFAIKQCYDELCSEPIEFITSDIHFYLCVGAGTVDKLNELARVEAHYLSLKYDFVIIRVSGDDTILSMQIQGFRLVLENDFGGFDQSQTSPIVHQLILTTLSNWLDLSVIAMLYSNMGGRWGRVVQMFVKMMMGTGNPWTSLWNSLLALMFVLDVVLACLNCLPMVEYGMNLDIKEIIEQCDLFWGTSSKPIVRNSLEGATFLKGWWLRTAEGGLAWTPLPSRITKMFKMSYDSNYEVKYVPNGPSLIQERSYQQCLGLNWYQLCPIMSPIVQGFIDSFQAAFPRQSVKLSLEICDRAHKTGLPFKEYWVALGIEECVPLDEESYLTVFESRYGLSAPTSDQLERFQHVGAIQYHSPWVTAVSRIDYT